MTVSTEISHEEYTGNGVTTTFPYRFLITNSSFMLVKTADLDGNEATLVLNTDYTLTGVKAYSGGNVILTNALPIGWRILLERNMPLLQGTDLRNQGSYFAEVHEDAFDYMTMLIQKVAGWFNLALRRPSWISNHYDAQGYKISNVNTPTAAQDATNKAYVDGQIGSTNANAEALFGRTLRVPGSYIAPLPPLADGEGKTIVVQGGVPRWITPESGTATDVLLQLASSDEGKGSWLVNTPYNGNVQEIMGLSPYKRVGNIGSSVEMEYATDAVKYNGMYYIYRGTLPHTSTESVPDANYRCVGLLNGWPITHTRNWGVLSDGTDQTTNMQLMIANLPANSIVTSDMEPIYIADLQLTTNYPSVKFKGVRFAPFIPSGSTTLSRMFTCTRSGLVFEDVTIDKPALGSSITAVFHMTDTLNCRFTRITCTGATGTIGTFWQLYRVKESSWDNLRIDLDPSGYTGTLFESNYSVNNTINGGFVGFGLNFIRFTSAADPTFGNRSEGWYINNVVGVFFQLPINGLTVTACHVNNCQFDFCLTRFFEFTNGGYSSINNCWFANYSSTTSTSHAVVAGGTYTGIVITNNTFINNTGDNTRSLFSLNPSANYGARVTNNISSNFSLGVVLGAASQCFGNVFVGEGVVTGTNNAITHVRGLGLDLATKPATWTANANAAYLSFTNQYGTAYIRSVNGSSSDRIGLSFNTFYDGSEKQVMYLSDYTIRLPHLPADTTGAGTNGLYAGTDGIVRINR